MDKELEELKKMMDLFPKNTGLLPAPIFPQLLIWLGQMQKVLKEALDTKKEDDFIIVQAVSIQIHIISYFIAFMRIWSALTKENILTMSAESLIEFVNSIKSTEHERTENTDKINNFLSDLEFLLEKTDGHKDN